MVHPQHRSLNIMMINGYRFGEECVEEMVNWALKYVPPSSSPRILEVGSGNGTLLFALLDAEYQPERLYGIDYSPGSIKLARSIAIPRGGDNISFKLCDILKEDPSTMSSMSQENGFGWDLILDKGTFDAIALGVAPFDGYPSKIARMLKPGAYFLITCTFFFFFPKIDILNILVICSMQFH